MKKLERFGNFSENENTYEKNKENLLSDIRDICLEFSDDGISYNIYTNVHFFPPPNFSNACDCIAIRVGEDYEIKFKEVLEILTRLYNFVKLFDNWHILFSIPQATEGGDSNIDYYEFDELFNFSPDDIISPPRNTTLGNFFIYIYYQKKSFTNYDETIKVPIEVGDIVLGGRFKNKKMVVKKIGKNKKGDITINDKPLLKFRLFKESLEDKEYINDIMLELEDKGLQLFLLKDESLDVILISSNKNSKYFKFSDIKSEVLHLKSYLGDRWVKSGSVFESDPERHNIRINEEDYDKLDSIYNTESEGIFNFAIWYKE